MLRLNRFKNKRINGLESQCIAPSQTEIQTLETSLVNLKNYYSRVKQGLQLMLTLYAQIINEVGALKINWDALSPFHWRTLKWFLEQYPQIDNLNLNLSYGGEVFSMKVFFEKGAEQLNVLEPQIYQQIIDKEKEILDARVIYNNSLLDYQNCVESELLLMEQQGELEEIQKDVLDSEKEVIEAQTDLTKETAKSYLPYFLVAGGIGALYILTDKKKKKR